MNDTALPRIAGVFLLASLMTNIMAFFIGTSRGLAPPSAFDFGDTQQLVRLSAESGAHLFPLTLSLLSPVLAIPAGLGIYHVLRAAGWPALFGVVMFFVGMIKAPVFALLIAVIGTYQGMNVSGSAESVGRLTTVAVVQSIFLVIMADALFSIVFSKMGI